MPTDIIGGKPRLFVSTVFEREEWDVERFEFFNEEPYTKGKISNTREQEF